MLPTRHICWLTQILHPCVLDVLSLSFMFARRCSRPSLATLPRLAQASNLWGGFLNEFPSSFVVVCVLSAFVIMAQLQTFLEAVKGAGAEGRIAKIMAILQHGNVDVERIEQGFGAAVSAGTFGFIDRAIKQTDAKFRTTCDGYGPNSQHGGQDNLVLAWNTVLGKKEGCESSC